MSAGRLFLPNGSSLTCTYSLKGRDHGELNLGSAFVLHGERVDSAILELADGTRMDVSVTFGSRVGNATFVAP
jgi:hypothetical protein